MIGQDAIGFSLNPSLNPGNKILTLEKVCGSFYSMCGSGNAHPRSNYIITSWVLLQYSWRCVNILALFAY
jgi:hypothetical protein